MKGKGKKMLKEEGSRPDGWGKVKQKRKKKKNYRFF